MDVLCLESHRVDAGEISLIGASAVVINLAAVVCYVQVAASGDKHRHDIGELQRFHHLIGSGINDMESHALLHGKHILGKAHHVATLPLI